ncbi:MAG TPA: DUF3500 domain-containing protein [Planctomycetota bacterium]|nr:DUF3500 domain-containing protein [Planctomycetota bacterium]
MSTPIDASNKLSRRGFLHASALGAAGIAADTVGGPLLAKVARPADPPETLVKTLYESLTEIQKKEICFAWDHQDKSRGLLRSYLSNNWRITRPAIKSDFYTAAQQNDIRQIFEGLVNPDWIERFDKQFKDDLGGFGKAQSIALFGQPGQGKFEFVLSGRHGTVRCDGHSVDHVAFGGPILYGHAASGYYEKVNHPDNVFWHQAVAANNLYTMLDGKQQKQALLAQAPDEALIAFQGKSGTFSGIPIRDLSPDQKGQMQKVVEKLIEPYRQSNRDEVVACLKAQGGLDACSLTFYQEDALGKDGIWDNWRLEGPSFVWHYRGAPHVHVWVHVADDSSVSLNAKNDSGPLRK